MSQTEMARTKANDKQKMKESSSYAFDKVFAHYDEKIGGSTKYEDRKIPKTAKRNNGFVRQDMASVTTTA